MALPNGFLDELKARLSLAQVAGRKLTWDPRKSNPGRGDYWAPCPFHQEKTASFHVDDAKGFYYCFGCHAKGDALNFVRETENIGFMEAVELLAGEAGMTVPAQDPQARAQAQKKNSLHDIMEMAIQFYRMQLNSAGAAAAREYVAGRGLKPPILERYEIGFAPSGRTALIDHLKGKGIDIKTMDEAGLVIVPDSGAPFDRFRDRIMFPIRDGRSKPTGFGGRAMSADAKAKYLNSPDRPLFDKGRSLYNHAPARQAAGKTGSLIVAEGYMDVIALGMFGFDHAVAPLGTAITAEQLHLMWRMTDEPVIALDGDTAGLRAAMRLIDVALPLLKAGKSLRFALMPEGLDPDDLLKTSGAKAMEELLSKATPMAGLLWRRETEGKIFDSPERRAALDVSLKRLLAAIEDPSIRDHYRAEFRDRRRELFSPARTQQNYRPSYPRQNQPGRGRTPARPTAGAKTSMLARATGSEAEARIRETSILRTCLANPSLVERFESRLEALPFLNGDLSHMRDVLLASLPDPAVDDPAGALKDAMAQRLPSESIEAVLRSGLALSLDIDDLVNDLEGQLSRHGAIIGQLNETRDAEHEITGDAAEGLDWRQQEALKAREEAVRIGLTDSEENSEEMARNSAFLTQMVEEARKGRKKS